MSENFKLRQEFGNKATTLTIQLATSTARYEAQDALLIKLLTTQLFDVMPLAESDSGLRRCETFFIKIQEQLKHVTAADFDPIKD